MKNTANIFTRFFIKFLRPNTLGSGLSAKRTLDNREPCSLSRANISHLTKSAIFNLPRAMLIPSSFKSLSVSAFSRRTGGTDTFMVCFLNNISQIRIKLSEK